MTGPPESRDPIAAAAIWVSRITTVALVMVVPGLIGSWLDERLGTKFLAPLGFALGLVSGMYHLLVITGAVGRKRTGGDTTKGKPKVPNQQEEDPLP